MNLPPPLGHRITTVMGAAPVHANPAGGGCIANAWEITLSDQRRIFAKTVSTGSPFPAEALGLQHLHKANGVRVPHVYHADPDLLLLEFIPFGQPAADWQETLGRQLAQTHRHTDTHYGFDLDHFIGSTPQKNLPRLPDTPGAWSEFWWTYRLEPMIRRLPATHQPAFSTLESRVRHWTADTGEAPAILHGDLWSGNAAADQNGQPILFDPAPYFGHREADLAMTRMFGGFTEPFYAAYHEAFPLQDGWSDRLNFYMLYHVLNHIVLFGNSYLPQAQRILARCK